MHVGMILEMAADSLGDRVALGPLDGGLTFAELGHRARRAGTWLAAAAGRPRGARSTRTRRPCRSRCSASAIAGKPFVPVNYRLADDRLRSIVERAAPALGDRRRRAWRRGSTGVDGIEIVERAEFLATVEDESDRGDRRLGLRPRGHRRAAVHERHHR